MEARKSCAALVAALPVLLGASYRTQNFIVNAPNAQVAKDVGDAAETLSRRTRDRMARQAAAAVGPALPDHRASRPQPRRRRRDELRLRSRRSLRLAMTIQGSHERILDSVLPHEVTHTIFASHFRQPVPRWADEGACTTVEHVSERTKQQQMLIQFLQDRPRHRLQLDVRDEGVSGRRPAALRARPLAGDVLHRPRGQGEVSCNSSPTDCKTKTGPPPCTSTTAFKTWPQLQNTWLDWVRPGSRPLQPGPAGDQPIVLASATADRFRDRLRLP